MKKIIRIQAKCNAFEIDDQIEESKTLARLKQIKSYFMHRKTAKILNKLIYSGSDNLVVTTSVINPTLL